LSAPEDENISHAIDKHLSTVRFNRAFASIGNGILIVLYAVAQIISYTQTKKFFHDQLSNTVIGERLN
jgi:hypothetical protein